MANEQALTGIDFREGYIAVIDKPIKQEGRNLTIFLSVKK
jgi:hypothetical protein